MNRRLSVLPLGSFQMPALNTVVLLRVLAVAGMAVLIALSPGFFSAPTMLSLVTTISFVGVVAVGMTLITVSGNIMSFSLGATTAASALTFVAVLNVAGLAAGIIAGLLVGALTCGVQGFFIGWLRANPIIVSIAGLTVITGAASGLTNNAMLYADEATGYEALRGKVFGIPAEFLVMIAVIVMAELMLRFTLFGRNLLMTGASYRVAEAAGIARTTTVFVAYALAGALAGLAGIMLAVRYGSASMEYGIGYDYNAIAAVLVGGTAIQGGQGSAIRTFIGLVIITLVQTLLLLHGFGTEWQQLITGIVVLGVVMLQTPLGR